ncbi:MAG TPA: flagellar biosynthesis protein FlhA [Fimbriimonadaceae bacterium]|nr:flagellar biosynthesis protein FlhA [Fimbriimonadaceae bacterium]HRJ97186.1 flagellar biosynthesis protein FlhA [Fimbriimonadaceae bacterium]
MTTLQKILKHTDLLLGFGLLVVVAMLILPLPHWALDTGLVIAIAASVMILLMSVNASDPLQFSVFPSLLLITTLFRLALSVAATKLILGTGAAGHVIETFGNFVMGGDPVVGFVAFLILVIIQFIVITNGAGRVSEVVARFTLDAMPGKQMAIDADLAAGLIDEDQARERRKAVKQEADFYGAMDGASKFVKGDAIAAILIIAVNIIGGFVVGFMRGGGDAMTILKTYSLLSVGEGLVAQVPALLISTASGLLVTRAGQERSMGGAVIDQVLGQPKAIGTAAAALAVFAFVPGFPAMVFLGVAGVLFGVYRYVGRQRAMMESLPSTKEEPKGAHPTGPEAVLPLLGVDPLEIEIGYGLTRLADARAGGDLPDRVTATRRQIALELGFVMPSVRIRDSVALQSNEYVLKVRGEEVARGSAEPGLLMAINSGQAMAPVVGVRTTEPVFGLEATWVEPALREQAERSGYTVVEPSAVIATHLSEVVKSHAPELLSRQDVATLIDHAKQLNQQVVDEAVPALFSVGEVQKVLQHLLRERVPIRDMVTVLETMADYGSRVKDPDQLGELVRSAIARTITRQYVDHENKLYCITLESTLERTLTEALQQTAGGLVLALEPVEQQQIIGALKEEGERAMAQGLTPVLLCSSQLRLPVRRLLERYLPALHVMAYNEVAARAEVEFVGQVKAA